METGSSGTTAGELLVRCLAEHGIDYIFGNSGTDFPPIIEALAKASLEGSAAPTALAIPHENLAVAMAYGHTMVSGRPQSVMVHVNVGTANTICGLLNAARDRIPMLVTAGRTPFTEKGHHGSRSIYSHWGQEMFDQAAMLREIVKWDYELNMPDQIEVAIDRAIALATSEPRRPVYMTLPREVLAGAVNGLDRHKCSPREHAPEPSSSAITSVAHLLAAANRPLIITSMAGADPKGPALLSAVANKFAIPVISHIPKRLCISTNDPMHLGFDPDPHLPDADLILLVDCDVPWIPIRAEPGPDAKVVHLGVDPLYSRYPMRTFRADLIVNGNTTKALEMLLTAFDTMDRAGDVTWRQAAQKIETRRSDIAKRREAWRNAEDRSYERKVGDVPINPAVVTRAINSIKADDSIVISELGVVIEHLTMTQPGTYFSASTAGGLGWGLGAALGAKLAAPDKLVIATIGDGSYMLGNPTPAHFVARAYDLPILFVVFNNAAWVAVMKATEVMYPNGYSSQSNRMPLTQLQPSPAFEKVIEASGGYGERVETLESLRPALERAIYAVKVERRQALLNVACSIPATRPF